MEREWQHGVGAVQLRAGKEETFLAHGSRDCWAQDIVFVVSSMCIQELALLRVPIADHAGVHVIGATTPLGPDVIGLVNGSV